MICYFQIMKEVIGQVPQPSLPPPEPGHIPGFFFQRFKIIAHPRKPISQAGMQAAFV